MWNSFEWDINTRAHIFGIPQSKKYRTKTAAEDVFSNIKFPLQSWWLFSLVIFALSPLAVHLIVAFNLLWGCAIARPRNPEACIWWPSHHCWTTERSEHNKSHIQHCQTGNYQAITNWNKWLRTQAHERVVWNRRNVIVLSFHPLHGASIHRTAYEREREGDGIEWNYHK